MLPLMLVSFFHSLFSWQQEITFVENQPQVIILRRCLLTSPFFTAESAP